MSIILDFFVEVLSGKLLVPLPYFPFRGGFGVIIHMQRRPSADCN